MGKAGNRTQGLPGIAVTNSATLLEGKQLLGSEALVMDLAGRLDQVLQMSASEEVAQVDELAMCLVFAVDDTPSVLSTANSLTVHVDGLFAAYDGEGDEGLDSVSMLTVIVKQRSLTLICELTAASS